MTKEEWDSLTAEEQATRVSEKPSSVSDVKDDVVIINGKPRPLKNYHAEMSQKIKDDIMRELKPQQQPVQANQPNGQDYARIIQNAMEREMAETGGSIPVNTVLNLIEQATIHKVNQYHQTRRQAEDVIDETLEELEANKDYPEVSKKLKSAIKRLDPSNVSREAIYLIFNSLRGEMSEDIAKKRADEAVKGAEANKRILGEPSGSTGGASGGSRSVKLTEEQQQDMEDHGMEEEAYSKALKHKQEKAKERGAKNVPKTLYERLIF